MRRATKIVLWSLGVPLSVLAATVIFLALAGDDFYRWAMKQAIEGAIDRQVRVDGTFSFDLGWQPTLIVTDVWIEDADWTGRTEMVRAERMEIQVALGQLFSGILRVPRLVVQGVDVELEQSADRQRNWDIGRPGRSVGADELEDVVYPLFDFISLTDINVTYQDQGSGREIVLQLDSLKKLEEGVGDAPYALSAEGHVNDRPFRVSAQIGSIEDAIAAVRPYPLEVEVQSQNFSLDLSGTVDNLPNGRGLDVNVEFRSQSVYEMLRTLQIEGEVFGPARASARLKGDLASLAVEDIDLTIIAPSGEELKAEGHIANIVRGQGLDLQFAGKLDPESLTALGEPPPAIASIVTGLTDLGTAGHLTGDFRRLALRDLNLHLEHISGAEVAIQGSVQAELVGEQFTLKEFTATTQVFLPDESLVDDAIETHVPPMTDLSATAELAWTGDWIEVQSATVSGKAFQNVQISGSGKLGRLSGADFDFDLDVQMDLEGATPGSSPILYLIEGFSPSKWRAVEPPADSTLAGAGIVYQIQRELIDAGFDPGAPDGLMGPKTRGAIENYQRRQGLTADGRATSELLQHLRGAESADAAPPRTPKAVPTFPLTESLPDLGPTSAAMRLLFKDDVFRFEDLNLTLGDNGTEIKTVGFLGRLHDGPEGILTEIDMAVSFEVPSSRRFAELLPPETPEFRQIAGRFEVTGTENLLLFSGTEITAEGPVGLRAAVTGGSTEIDLEKDTEVRELTLALDARWPDTQSLYDFIEQDLPDIDMPDMDLPELGPVQAQATLRDSGETFSLAEISASAGTEAEPILRVTGDVADLPALSGVELAGDFAVNTALLLEKSDEPAGGELGMIRGQFELSDSDGSFGLEALSATVEDATLLSLTIDGAFDDIEQGDALRLTASLEVPDLAALGRELDFDAETIGRVSFDGELSGSDERFTATGKATFGETEITGVYSGTLLEEKPKLKAEISSPLFRLADVGLVPVNDEGDEPLEVSAAETAAPSSDEWIFDETPIPFEALKQFDLDLDVVLEDVEGVRLDVDKIEASIDIVDGELTVDPLTFDFVGGQAEVTLRTDTRPDEPQVSLDVSANNVNLEHLLSQARVEVPLDGTLDFTLDLTAEGSSPRELASSLNGTAEMAIADGNVLTGLLTLTTSSPVGWILSESAREGYAKMNCLIMRFDIEDGLAESQALLLDTPNMQAQGTGQIDFRDETMQINVNPRAKKRRLIPLSTPFSIEGRLADPSINVSTTGATLRTGGEVLLSPLNLLGSLLPFVGNGSGDEDNPCLTLESVAPTE